MEQPPEPQPRRRGLLWLLLLWAGVWLLMLPFSVFLAIMAMAGAQQNQAPEGSAEHGLMGLLAAVSASWPVACLVMPPVAFFIWRFGPPRRWLGFLALLLLWPAVIALIMGAGS